MLKIVSKCTNESEFVAVFQRFSNINSLFVVTRTPKPVGASSRLAVTLADGTPMLVGAGKIVDSFADRDNEFGRPGMRIQFSQLDETSKENLEKLNSTRRRRNHNTPPPPPRSPAPVSKSAARADAKPRPATAGARQGAVAASGSSTANKTAKAGNKTPMAGAIPPVPTRSTVVAATGTPVPAVPAVKATKPIVAIPNIPRISSIARPNSTPTPLPPGHRSERSVQPAPLGGASQPSPPTAAAPVVDVVDPADPHAVDDVPTRVSSLNDMQRATGASPTGETRAQGSDFILPANPFGSLTESSLEAFVECTLYEETGTIELDAAPDGARSANAPAPADEPANSEQLPPWWPQENSGAAAGSAPVAVGSVRSDLTPLPLVAPSEVRPAVAAAGMKAATVSPTPVGSTAAAMVTTRVRRRPPSWLPLAATAGITAMVTLVIGYFLFGGHRDDTSSTDKPVPLAATNASVNAPPGAENTASPPHAISARASAHVPVASTDDLGGDSAIDTGPEPTAPPTSPAVQQPGPSDSPAGATSSAAAGDSEGHTEAASSKDPTKKPGAASDGAEPSANQSGETANSADSESTAPDDCTLDIRANAEGARAFVAGKKLGTIPLRQTVDCATKQVEIRHPRYSTLARPVTLKPGAVTTVKARLLRPMLRLRVVSSPAGASVYVGSRRVGRTPLTIPVKGFLYTTVTLKKKGYQSLTKRLYPKRNVNTVRERMQRTPRRSRSRRVRSPRSRSSSTRR